MQDQLARASYDRLTNDPVFWRMSARSLKISARVLLPKAMNANTNNNFDGWGTRSVLNMLYAMSIECALKSVYLEYGNQIAKNGKLNKNSDLPWVANGPHDLVGLARSLPPCCVKLSANEMKFLDDIQPFIELGRYPTRSSCARANPGCLQTNPNGTGVIGTNYPMVPWCDDIFEELSTKLEAVESFKQQNEPPSV